MKSEKRLIFFLSDGTGITVESLGQSLLTQFEGVAFETKTFPHVDTQEKAEGVCQKIIELVEGGAQPIVLTTFANSALEQPFDDLNATVFHCFRMFLKPLEKTLGQPSSHTAGRAHGQTHYQEYMQRIEAVNFTLACDDGVSVHEYAAADLIILGVSRSGKTPTSLYLALQFGLRVANYPLIFEEDARGGMQWPSALVAHRDKCFGLTIDALHLQQIRAKRRPNTEYASLVHCEEEVRRIQQWYQREGIPYLDSTTRSVEEIATAILSRLKRRGFSEA